MGIGRDYCSSVSPYVTKTDHGTEEGVGIEMFPRSPYHSTTEVSENDQVMGQERGMRARTMCPGTIGLFFPCGNVVVGDHLPVAGWR